MEASIIAGLTASAALPVRVNSRTGSIAASAASRVTAPLEFSFGKGIKRRCHAADVLCRDENSRTDKVKNELHNYDVLS